MKYKKGILIICLIICLFSITSVCAIDVNETIVSSADSDIVSIEEQVDQNKNEIISVKEVRDNNIISKQNSENVLMNLNNDSNHDILSAKSSDSLNNIIQNAADGSIINLNSDYIISSSFSIDKNITIYGNGHTLNGNKHSIGISKYGNVLFDNIKFINCQSNNRGGVFSNYGNLTLNKCTFENNKAVEIESSEYANENDYTYATYSYAFGGAIYNTGNLNVINCNFKKNYAGSKNSAKIYYSYYNPVNVYSYSYGGAIYNTGNLNIIKTNFDENSANAESYGVFYKSVYAESIMIYSYSYGGAIYNTGNLNITDSKFNKNTAQSSTNCEGSEKYGSCKSNCFSNSYGGAIYNSKTLTIIDSSLINNNAYSYSYSNCNSSSDAISDSYSYGGAIFNTGSSYLRKVTMTDNKAIINSNFLKVTDPTIAVDIYSSAKTYGGSIYNEGELNAISININNFFAGDIFNARHSAKVKIYTYQEMYGAFIYNAGILTMSGEVLYDNNYLELFGSRYVEYAEQSMYGGVIYNDGNLKIFNTSFKRTSDYSVSSNLDNNNNYRKQMYGGLIYNGRVLDITNSSFNNNFNICNYSWIYGSYIYNKGVFNLNSSNLSVASVNTTIHNVKSFLVYNSYLTGFTIKNYNDFVQLYGSYLINLDLNNNFCKCNINNSILNKVVMNHKNNDLTITNSNMTYRAISIEKSFSTFNNNVFNMSGVTSLNATLNFNNCSFKYCRNMYGGAIYGVDSSIEIANSSFIANFANYGGAIYGVDSSIEIANSIFKSNSASSGGGGAVYGTKNCDFKVFDSTFMYNTAHNDEGGAFNVYKLNANNCTFIKNKAISCAAIKVLMSGSLVNCSLFYGNSVNNKTNSSNYICYINNGTVINSIFLNNTADVLFYKSTIFDYNWFGNTFDDYLIKPINDVSLNNWLYLYVIHEESMGLDEKNPIQFIFYAWDGDNVVNYNSLNLHEYELLVTCTNGKLDKNSIFPPETIFYTPNNLGNCNITVKFLDKELTINLTCKYPSKIIANESITILVDQIMNFDDNGLCAKLIPSGIGELIYSSDNESILNISDNEFKGIVSGIANIIIEFKGNNEYAPTKTLVPITVLKSDVEIITNDTIIMDYSDYKRIEFNSTKNIENFIFSCNDENIATVNKNGVISAVGVGNTTINIIFEGNEKYHAVNKTINLIINNKNSSIILRNNISFKYGSSGYTVVDSSIGCIDFNVSVLNHPEAEITVLNNRRITVSNLDVGDYTLVITTIPFNNYLSVNITSPITVKKAFAYSSIPKTFEYNSSITVNVNCNGSVGLRDVEVKDHPEALININGTSITISELDVGTYTLILTTVPDKNHISVKSSHQFTIIKVDSEIGFSNNLIFDYGGLDYTVANIKYATNITNVFVYSHPEAIINIKNNIISVSGLNVGNYTLYASTVPDKNHKSVTGSTKITVNKVYSTLSIENDIIFDYGSSNFTYVIFDGAKSIKVYVSDNSSVVNVNDGKITVSGLNAGNYTLYVYTIPDENHISVNVTAKIFVNKINPKITVSPVIYNYGQTGSTKILTDDNVNIEAKVINHPEAIVSISNKLIAISNLDAGNYKLEVNTHSTNNYNPITLTTDITVNKIQPTISVSDIVCDYGTSGSTKVILDGASKFNANINGDSNHLTINNNVINVNGLDAGTYTLTVTTVSDNNHDATTSISKIVVNRLNTVLTSASVSKVYGTSKNIVIKLNDVHGNLLVGESVKIRINNIDYYGTVNSNGHAVIAIPTNLAVKTYTATISYDGNANYEKSTDTVKVTVKKATLKITAKAKTFKKSVKTKKYSITLKNNLNKVMKNTKVTIKVNKKTYTAKTNKKGVATFKIKKLTKKGTFKSVITYKGDKYYNKVTKTVKIKVR